MFFLRYCSPSYRISRASVQNQSDWSCMSPRIIKILQCVFRDPKAARIQGNLDLSSMLPKFVTDARCAPTWPDLNLYVQKDQYDWHMPPKSCYTFCICAQSAQRWLNINISKTDRLRYDGECPDRLIREMSSELWAFCWYCRINPCGQNHKRIFNMCQNRVSRFCDTCLNNPKYSTSTKCPSLGF